MTLEHWDYFYLTAHTALIAFNLFGWVVPLTRRLNLFALLATGLSWTALGYWYGLGYCPLTDWHWQVLERLGNHNLPRSYITYLAIRMFGIHPNEDWVDVATATAFGAALLCSIVANIMGNRRERA